MKRRKTLVDTLIMVLTLFGFIAIGLVIGDKIRNRLKK
jgi:hypothetical protein